MAESAEPRSDRRRLALTLVAVAGVSMLPYLPSLGNDFVWDSEAVIREDPTIRHVRHLPQYFTESFTLETPGVEPPPGLDVSHVRYYRPVAKILRLVEHALFGGNPLGYKATSLVLNALVVALGCLFVLGATGDRRLALASSLLYAVNPTRAEVVCWVYSDASLLAALFSLAALGLYQRGRPAPALAAGGLALLSHEGAIVLPAVVGAYELLVRRGRGRAAWGAVAGFFVLAAGYLSLRGAVAGPPPITGESVLGLANAVAVIVQRFTRLWLVPDRPLTVHLREDGMFSGPSPEVVASWAILLIVGVLALFLWRRHRGALFWLAWFLIWPSVTFNVGAFGDYLLAEKTLYLAALGPAVLLTSAALGAGHPRAGLAVLAVLFVLHFGTTVARTRHWKDTVTYLEAAVESAPDFVVARYALGDRYARQGQHAKARDQYAAALAHRPELVFLETPLAEMHFALGVEHAEAGRLDEALAEFQECLERRPAHSRALNNVGTIHYLREDPARAREAWEQAAAVDPTNPQPHHNLALLLEREGDLAGALERYRRHAALLADPPAGLRAKILELEDRLSSTRAP